MYRDQKPPESIVTTETHTKRYDVTLNKCDAHRALINEACRQVGIDATNPNLKADASVWESPENWDGVCEINYSVVLVEDLSKPAITDFAPPNIEEIVRLNPPTTPGLSKDQMGVGIVFKADDQEVLRISEGSWISYPIQHLGITNPTSKLNVTATSSRENVDAIERMKEKQPALLKAMDINARYTEIKTGIPRDLWMEDLMKRVNRLHEVLLHGKGNNIVLSRGEVDTLLEYINVGALALDKVKTVDA
jgi:hypothetical protein